MSAIALTIVAALALLAPAYTALGGLLRFVDGIPTGDQP